VGTAQEERVAQHVAQTPERLADGGLGQAEFTGDIHGLAVPQEAEEDQKQGQVQPTELTVA
jgi:hypothetical protein